MNKWFSNSLPLHFYHWSSVPMWIISIMLTYLVVSYTIHGGEMLEADDKMKFLAALAAIALATSQQAAFTTASMLSSSKFTVWCFSLRAFAVFICAVEFFTSCGMQLSTALSTDMVQTQVNTREDEIKTRIKRIEASAQEKRERAKKQDSVAKEAYDFKLAAKSSREASDEDKKAEQLYAELKMVQANRAPTFVGSLSEAGKIVGVDLGKAFAVSLIISRMFGLCLGAALFAGLGGALWRRGSTAVSLEKNQSSDATQAPCPAPQQTRSWMMPTWKQAALVPSTAGAAAGVSAQPPQPPTPAPVVMEYRIEPKQVDFKNLTPAPLAKKEEKPEISTPTAPEQVQIEEKQVDLSEKSPLAPKKRKLTPEEYEAHVMKKNPLRYAALVQKLQPGAKAPSQEEVKLIASCRQEVAAVFIRSLKADGHIVQDGKRWTVRKS